MHPETRQTTSELLELCREIDGDSARCVRVLPVRSSLLYHSRKYIAGILNVTPDSFSDPGEYFDPSVAVKRALQMIKDGATVIDMGGQSTKPNAVPISADLELERVLPVLKLLRDADATVIISIDTFNSSVAKACLENGCDIINDVSGGERDEHMAGVVSAKQCGFISMHMRGDSGTMMGMTDYPLGITVTVQTHFINTLEKLVANGVFRWNVIMDPGLGFAKTGAQSRELMRNLRSVCGVADVPLMVGVSRKSFLGDIVGRPVTQRISATISACTLCAYLGAMFLRVHDVAQCRDALLVAEDFIG